MWTVHMAFPFLSYKTSEITKLTRLTKATRSCLINRFVSRERAVLRLARTAKQAVP